MKTTLELPEDLMRAVKMRAVERNRKLKDTIAELLRRGLAREREAPPAVRRRVRLPLVRCAHAARPDTEVSFAPITYSAGCESSSRAVPSAAM